jgi:hypothetical protein
MFKKVLLVGALIGLGASSLVVANNVSLFDAVSFRTSSAAITSSVTTIKVNATYDYTADTPTVKGNPTVLVSWQLNNKKAGATLYRKVGNEKFAPVATIATSSITSLGGYSYRDKDIVKGKKYTYYVKIGTKKSNEAIAKDLKRDTLKVSSGLLQTGMTCAEAGKDGGGLGLINGNRKDEFFRSSTDGKTWDAITPTQVSDCPRVKYKDTTAVSGTTYQYMFRTTRVIDYTERVASPFSKTVTITKEQ